MEREGELQKGSEAEQVLYFWGPRVEQSRGMGKRGPISGSRLARGREPHKGKRNLILVFVLCMFGFQVKRRRKRKWRGTGLRWSPSRDLVRGAVDWRGRRHTGSIFQSKRPITKEKNKRLLFRIIHAFFLFVIMCKRLVATMACPSFEYVFVIAHSSLFSFPYF